jgi:Leu/Phe-tRNA-protein transferase
MITWVKRLLWDEATAAQYLRTGLAGIWAAYETGILPVFAEESWMWYVSRACLVLAFLMRAGDQNEKKP